MSGEKKQSGGSPFNGRPIRVGISGAGPSGLCIAGILAREAPGRFEIEVFERDARERDQGSGWDINAPGREVLRRAGLDAATISRPDPRGESCMRSFRALVDEPFLVVSVPKPFNRWIKSDPETNRNAMREGLLNANPGIKITFKCGVFDLQLNDAGGVTFFGSEGQQLGQYDIGIDASGVATPLRKHRVPGSSIKDWYTGVTSVGGVIEDPETEVDPEVVRRLGQGTLMVLGDTFDSNHAMAMLLQRYGCKEEDHRSQFGLCLARESMTELGEELGLTHSNKSVTETDQKETLARVKTWMKAQMGDKWDPMYVGCVDSMRNVQVRPIFMFNPEVVPTTDTTVPFICVGDALHAMAPFTGTGGNFALMDAGELGTFLVKYALGKDRRELVPALREVELKCFRRAAEVVNSRGAHTGKTLVRVFNTKNVTANYSLSVMLQGETGWTLFKRIIYILFMVYMWVQKLVDYNMAPKKAKAKSV